MSPLDTRSQLASAVGAGLQLRRAGGRVVLLRTEADRFSARSPARSGLRRSPAISVATRQRTSTLDPGRGTCHHYRLTNQPNPPDVRRPNPAFPSAQAVPQFATLASDNGILNVPVGGTLRPPFGACDRRSLAMPRGVSGVARPGGVGCRRRVRSRRRGRREEAQVRRRPGGLRLDFRRRTRCASSLGRAAR